MPLRTVDRHADVTHTARIDHTYHSELLVFACGGPSLCSTGALATAPAKRRWRSGSGSAAGHADERRDARAGLRERHGAEQISQLREGLESLARDLALGDASGSLLGGHSQDRQGDLNDLHLLLGIGPARGCPSRAALQCSICRRCVAMEGHERAQKTLQAGLRRPWSRPAVEELGMHLKVIRACIRPRHCPRRAGREHRRHEIKGTEQMSHEVVPPGSGHIEGPTGRRRRQANAKAVAKRPVLDFARRLERLEDLHEARVRGALPEHPTDVQQPEIAPAARHARLCLLLCLLPTYLSPGELEKVSGVERCRTTSELISAWPQKPRSPETEFLHLVDLGLDMSLHMQWK
mmetsp:Transcript_172735/g.553687  ORF Transcript_172735/g.553687 Transcript_172735/m.553687 type:complete len:349 (-) Transcript_172735:588-1634(-)